MDTNVSPIISSDYYINQADSYVRDIKLGNGSKTVKQAGCYICSIATIVCWYLGDSSESTKTAIVKQMAKNCTTGGGYDNSAVKYDGRTFRINTKISDMAQKLLDGYPCICQVPGHFVVINGYDTNRKGMDAYLVLDPGRRANETLQDVMDEKGNQIVSKRFVYED